MIIQITLKNILMTEETSPSTAPIPISQEQQPQSFDPSTDESDSDEQSWENKNVFLRPNQLWKKSIGREAILTMVSMSIKPETIDGAFGCLTIHNGQTEAKIATIYPNNPTQCTRLLWSASDEIYIMNTGTHPITIFMLIRDIGF